MTLELPDYPFHPSEALRADPALLDSLLQDYAHETRDAQPDAARFLFGFAPLCIFDRVLLEPLPSALPTEGFLWVLHLSGYFGGAWLRAEIRRAQPQSPLARAGIAPTRTAFDAISARAAAALRAARCDGPAVLGFVEGALAELVAGFGYNRGYLLQILEQPPAGRAAPPGFVVPRLPLWCDYANPRLRALPALREAAEQLAASPDPRWRKLADAHASRLSSEEARGRQVWSSGFSVQGFDAAAYERLLDVSSSFLEVMQASALTAALALAEERADLGRRAALAQACLAPWLGSYGMGLMDAGPDPEAERQLPALRP